MIVRTEPDVYLAENILFITHTIQLPLSMIMVNTRPKASQTLHAHTDAHIHTKIHTYVKRHKTI